MIFVGLLLNILIFGLVIFGIKKIFSNSNRHVQKEGAVRRFFQLTLLFGLTIISAIGLSGLTGRIIPIGDVLTTNRETLALESAFAAVGLPLLLLIIVWVKKTVQRDPEELQTLAWNLYLTAITIISLILLIVAQVNIYNGFFTNDDVSGKDFSQLLVWGAVWLFHFRWHKQVGTPGSSLSEHLIGSAIGLGFSFVGLLTLFSSILSTLFNFNENTIIVSSFDPIIDGLITLAIGLPIWFIYWVKSAEKQPKEPLWYGYVLLVGVGASLLMTLLTAALSINDVLVWFLGDVSADASTHFGDLTQTIGAAMAGSMVLFYHRQVLENSQEAARSDIRRVYEYVISAIGLAAAAGGVTLILVSIIESIFGAATLSISSSVNTLIGAFTLILVGGSVWVLQWRSIQSSVKRYPVAEQGSIIRRGYLLLLFGVVGLTAVIVLVTTAYLLFYDLFQNGISTNTVNKIRFPLAIFLTSGVVSKYHWNIYKIEKDIEVIKEKSSKEAEKIYFFVEIKLKPRSAEKVIDVLNKYATHVRKEKGCEKLDVLRDPKSKSTIYLYEIWTTTADHKAHLASEGFAGWKAYSDPLISSFEVKSLTHS